MATLGDPQAEVVRRAAHRLRRLRRAPLPQVAGGGDAARSGTPRAGGSSPWAPKAKSRVRTPRCATCRIRSVGSSRDAERVGDVEAVRPGLHEAGGGHRGRAHRRPEPGHLLAGGVGAQRLLERRTATARQRASRSARSALPPSSASASTKPSGRRSPARTSASQASLSVAAATATSSVQARWATWVATSQPARRGRRAPAGVVEVGDEDRLEGGALGGEVAQTPVAGSSFMRVSRPARVEGVAQASRIRRRRAVSSVIVLARPRPRTRSSVACTSSRARGRDSSTPRASTAIRWASRPTRCSSGTTAACSASSVRAATQSSRAAMKTGAGEVVGEHLQHGAGAPLAGRQARAASRSSCAAQLAEVLDGGEDQVVLGREVVQLGPAADAGALGDQRGRRAAPAVLDQAARRSPRAGAAASRGCAPPAARGRRRLALVTRASWTEWATNSQD